MRLWYDKTGEAWTVDVNVGAMLRIRDLAGLDLVDQLGVNRSLLWLDEGLAGQALWCICYEQVQQRQLSPEQFEERFDAVSLGKAREAVDAEIVDFFPAWSRPLMRRLSQQMSQLSGPGLSSGSGPVLSA